MHGKNRLVTGLVAGISAGLALALPADAATPRATLAYSSSTYLTDRFSVQGAKIAILACTTVNEVRTGAKAEALPRPGCAPRVEGGGGVAYSRDGSVLAHTVTVRHVSGGQVDGRLYRTGGSGRLPSTDVAGHEYRTNPDQRVRYGTGSTSRCVTSGLGGDAGYTGRADSFLASVAAGPNLSWYVADRDGNKIYRVDRAGKLLSIATLPPVTVTVSAALAKRVGWPSCVVGTKVAFEAAPTEVEVGADGTLYVAGRPKLKSGITSDRSVVYVIDPTTRKVRRSTQTYPGAVDLAAGTAGKLFIAQPSAGQISVRSGGVTKAYLKLARLMAVETDAGGQLYAVRAAGASLTTTPPSIVRIS
jgi:hypothetical protein